MRYTLAELIVSYFMDIHDKSISQIPRWLMNTIREMKKPTNFVLGFPRMVEISQKNKDYLSRSLQKYFNIKFPVCQY